MFIGARQCGSCRSNGQTHFGPSLVISQTPPLAHSISLQLVDGAVMLATSLDVNVNISSVIGCKVVGDDGVDESVKNGVTSSGLVDEDDGGVFSSVADGVVSSFAVTSSEIVVLSISDVLFSWVEITSDVIIIIVVVS